MTFLKRRTPNAERPISNPEEGVDLAVLAIEAGNFALRLAIDGALFQVGAFVACHFTLGNAELRF